MPFPAGGCGMTIGPWPAPCQPHPVPLASNRSQTLSWVGSGEPDFWINSLHDCLYRDPINFPLQPRGPSDHFRVPSAWLPLLQSATMAVILSCQALLQACLPLSSQGLRRLWLHDFGLAIAYCLNCAFLDQLHFLTLLKQWVTSNPGPHFQHLEICYFSQGSVTATSSAFKILLKQRWTIGLVCCTHATV